MSPSVEIQSRLESEVTELRDEVTSAFEAVAELRLKQKEHDVRFSNGREVMADMKADIALLKPKAPDWLKLLGAATIALGAHYWLIEQLNDRPTNFQIEKAFREHSESGHPTLQRDVDGLKNTLHDLKKMVGDHNEKFDLIIQRLPKPPVKTR